MSSPTDKAVPPEGVIETPAPWTLASDSWVFFFYTGVPPGGAPEDILPSGAFHPLEVLSEDAKEGFVGGLGGVLVNRFTESPVGPYDELVYVAGFFKAPGESKTYFRITNIYVSSESSAWNGRRNWNVPKHLARFEFSSPAHSTSPEPQTVRVFHPSASLLDSKTPFFTARLTPSRLPSITLNTPSLFLPQIFVVQPPLHPAAANRKDHLAKYQVGTHHWDKSTLFLQGGVTPAYISPLPASSGESSSSSSWAFGDGVSFPRCEGLWRIGLRWKWMRITFPPAISLGDKKND